MEVKKCFKCGETKVLSEFYRHKNMPDGHVNKCKECNKNDVQENYRRNRPHYIEYEKERCQRPGRKRKALDYQKKRRRRSPVQYHANNLTNSAIKHGRLIRRPCEVCGKEKVEAHHDDYYKPLEVRWLCKKHHLGLHGKISDGE